MRRISHHNFQKELERIVDNLRQYQPQQIILFGSFARGDHHALSDVDLLIVKETTVSFVNRIGPVLALCGGNDTLPVEPIIYTPEELEQMKQAGNPFIERVLAEGVVVYECQSAGSGSLAEASST